MKRMSILGLCITAAFAFAAIAVSSASAFPEVGACVAKSTGKYKDSGCIGKATGTEKGNLEKWEWEKGETGVPKNKFTATSGASSLETEGGTKIECSGSTSSGEYKEKGTAAIKEVQKVVAKFTGCTIGVAKKACGNTGANEITTEELKGPLGFLNAGKTEVGSELKPTATKGKTTKKGEFVSFECVGTGKVIVGEGTGKLGDCIIAPITSPVNVMSTTENELYSGINGEFGREQVPQHFYGKTTHCNLESKLGEGGWERSIQSQPVVLTGEQAAEVKTEA